MDQPVENASCGAGFDGKRVRVSHLTEHLRLTNHH